MNQTQRFRVLSDKTGQNTVQHNICSKSHPSTNQRINQSTNQWSSNESDQTTDQYQSSRTSTEGQNKQKDLQETFRKHPRVFLSIYSASDKGMECPTASLDVSQYTPRYPSDKLGVQPLLCTRLNILHAPPHIGYVQTASTDPSSEGKQAAPTTNFHISSASQAVHQRRDQENRPNNNQIRITQD